MGEITYSEMLAICMAYFGMTLLEARRCTVREYHVNMIAYRLREHKEIYHMNLLAWQINQARAVKKNGNPAFRNFRQFYDSEKNFIQALKGKSIKEKKQMSMAEMNMRLNN